MADLKKELPEIVNPRGASMYEYFRNLQNIPDTDVAARIVDDIPIIAEHVKYLRVGISMR